MVTEVERGSRAARAGLKREDIIVEVDRKPVANAEEAVAALGVGGKASRLLRVRRGGAFIFVTIPAP